MGIEALERLGEPGAEPIDIAEARQHCNIVSTEDDAQLALFTGAVREYLEDVCGVALVAATYRLPLEEWPCSGVIELPMPPLVDVQSITYTLEDGSVETLDSSTYVVDTASRPGRVLLQSGESWPSDALQVGSPIAVRYRAGALCPVTADPGTDRLTALGRTFAAGTELQLAVSGGEMPGGLQARTAYHVVNPSGSTFQLSATSGGSAINITDAGTGTLLAFTGAFPRSALQAARFLLGHWYEHREAVIDIARRDLVPVPLGVKSLIWLIKRTAF